MLSGSMIVLSIPRRHQGPTCAESIRNPNNELVNRTFDTTGGRVPVPAGGVLSVDGANKHPRPQRLPGRSLRGTRMVGRGRGHARLVIRLMLAPLAERLV